MKKAQDFLDNPSAVAFTLAAFSAAALGMALIAQYAFGLQPCPLCIYQRWPYGIVIGLGLLAFLAAQRGERGGALLLSLCSLLFLLNSGIAFYHTGVELHWWKSFLEGCAVPKLEGNIADVLAKIKATPTARCDEIPWADPVLGLSMANYNVIVSLGLFAVSLLGALRAGRR